MDTNADHGHFGDLLRMARAAARISQRQLAAEVGLSVAAIRDLEQGRTRRPRRRFVEAMVIALALTGDSEAAFRAAADQHSEPPPPTGLVQVQILGPLLVSRGGRTVPVGRGRRRVLLGRLALAANTAVPTADLIDLLWGADPPPAPAQAVQTYVSRLRSALQPDPSGEPSVVTWTPGGYQLNLSEDQLDLADFRRQVRRARAAEPSEAIALLENGLDLRRGTPFADLCELRTHPLSVAIVDEYIVAALWYADLCLASGSPQRCLPRLRELTAMDPLHEPLHARLMAVLAASNLQAAALAVYADIRARLIDDLGIEPGPALVDAHRRVLRQEPFPAPASTQDTAAGSEPNEHNPPAQLPANTPSFAGRVAALSWLDDLFNAGHRASAMVIAAISGTAGVGKTTLATHWAHRVSDRFADGTLYVNLNGFGPDRRVLDPAEVLRRFLDALGVPATQISHGLDARVAQYRNVIRGRRMLVVLDNARDADHVRPLLPDTPTAAVLVTSRHQLTGLVVTEWARPLQLGLMSPAESHELLIGRLGPGRARQQPGMAERIVMWCAGLPLALAIVGARAQQTEFPLEAVADELAATSRPLDALDGGDSMTRIRSVFSWSYRALTPGAARLFRLLGLNPGGDIGLCAAASLAGLSEAEVRVQLKELMSASLLAEPNPSRYTMHDLLRAYATELACDEESPDRQRDALRRLLDHYLHTAVAADRQLSPQRRPSVIPLRDPAPHTSVGRLTEPLAWFASERSNLLAVLGSATDLGMRTQVWQLAWAADSALERQGHWSDFAHAWRLALSVAGTLRDVRAQAFAHRRLAYAYMLLGHETDAGAQLSQALRLYEKSGDALGQAVVHHSLSNLYDHRQDPTRALHHAEQALTWAEQADDANEQAAALNAIGWCHTQLGHHAEALTHCQRALRLIDPNNHRALADTWDSIGFAHHHLSDFIQATDAYRHALTLARQAGARHLEATVLTHLGDNHHAAGEPAAAQDAWEPALKIMLAIDATAADEIRDRLAVGEKP